MYVVSCRPALIGADAQQANFSNVMNLSLESPWQSRMHRPDQFYHDQTNRKSMWCGPPLPMDSAMELAMRWDCQTRKMARMTGCKAEVKGDSQGETHLQPDPLTPRNRPQEGCPGKELRQPLHQDLRWP